MRSEAENAAIIAEAVGVCRARLKGLGALAGDDSLRIGRAAASVRGLSHLVATVPSVESFDSEGVASLLWMIADDLERCAERQMLDELTRQAA